MSTYERLNEIGGKKIFETGSEKEFIRAKDIDWLIDTVFRQQVDIDNLEDVYNDRCEDINFYVERLKEIVSLIESDYTQGEISIGDSAGFSKLLNNIYQIAKDSTAVEDFKFM